MGISVETGSVANSMSSTCVEVQTLQTIESSPAASRDARFFAVFVVFAVY
jgi:hypothetical protein